MGTSAPLVPPALVELAVLHSQTLHVRIYFECVGVGLDPLFTPEPRHHLIYSSLYIPITTCVWHGSTIPTDVAPSHTTRYRCLVLTHRSQLRPTFCRARACRILAIVGSST